MMPIVGRAGRRGRRSPRDRGPSRLSSTFREPSIMAGATPVLDDHFRDHCGLFGIYGHPEAARLTYLGLYAQQHRGQESAGIVASDGQRLRLEKAMGLLKDGFHDARLGGVVR